MTSRYAISWINTRILKEELAYAFYKKKKKISGNTKHRNFILLWSQVFTCIPARHLSMQIQFKKINLHELKIMPWHSFKTTKKSAFLFS